MKVQTAQHAGFNPAPSPLEGRGRGEGCLTTTPRRLRKAATDAERLLWSKLRSRQLAGYKFRRQAPIGPFVADFVCKERMLIIEVDGGHHAGQVAADEQRQSYLESVGFRCLRFWNNQVLRETEAVLTSIMIALEESPSP